VEKTEKIAKSSLDQSLRKDEYLAAAWIFGFHKNVKSLTQKIPGHLLDSSAIIQLIPA
jgi:hypothetical protein